MLPLFPRRFQDPHQGRGMARILIVDDEAPIRKLLVRFLSRKGHECDTANTADEAWTLLTKQPYDLVLSDVNMPGTSGLDLAPRIAEDYPDTPVVMVTGVDDAEVAERAVEAGAYGYITKPFVPNEILIGVMNALRRRDLEIENRRHRENLMGLVAERTRELREAHERVRFSQEETIRRLSIASEYRDEETGEHIQRMSRYCALLAHLAGMDADYVELVRVASPLHDVGKIAIPDSILRKPGKHTPEETARMRQHAEAGYRILAGSGIPLLDMAADIAWTHHERWDGGGYPRGLKGDEIPLEGRLTAISDVFDALTTQRVYKPAFTVEHSLQLMREGQGTHFDPDLLDVFLTHIDEFVDVLNELPDAGALHL